MSKIQITEPKICWFQEANAPFGLPHYGSPDPVNGGVSVMFQWKNNTGKTGKYIKFLFNAYNRVGDLIADNFVASNIGPFAPGYISSSDEFSHNIGYANTCSVLKLVAIQIDYMDGTSNFFISDFGLQFLSSKYGVPVSEARRITKKNGNIPDEIETVSSLGSTTPPPTTNTSSGGCYIATAVYGSYDCPEVWTLRRFRDYSLAESWYGRLFIRIYYAVSPTLVKWFGKATWFKRIWKDKLDNMVQRLQNEGYENTPYNDKIWGK